jgi:hypothetical protein
MEQCDPEQDGSARYYKTSRRDDTVGKKSKINSVKKEEIGTFFHLTHTKEK